jgi:hypothetical protein
MSILKFERVLVTPDLARHWNSLGYKNRPVSKTAVLQYADEMRRGLWRETGEAMMVITSASVPQDALRMVTGLIEGQHRAHAVIECGLPQWFLVVFHTEDEDVFPVIGTGRTRRPKDGLSQRTGNYTAGAAVVRAVLAAESRSLFLGGFGNALFTNRDYLRRWDSDPETFESSCAFAKSMASSIKNIGTVAPGFFAYAFCDRHWFARFAEKMLTGAAMVADDPALALRNWIVGGVGQSATPVQRVATWVQVAGAMDEGRPLRKAQMPTSFPYKYLAGSRVVAREPKG